MFLKLNTEGQTIKVYMKTRHKVTKLKSKSSLILGWLNWAFNNLAQLITFFYTIFKCLPIKMRSQEE